MRLRAFEQVDVFSAVPYRGMKRDENRLAFAAPPLRKKGPLAEADVALIARGPGVAREDIFEHSWCDTGPSWRGVLLKSAAQVLSLAPDGAVLAGLDVGVVGARGERDGCAFEVRAQWMMGAGWRQRATS